MMNDSFEQVAARGATAVREWVADHGDPEADLAAILAGSAPLEEGFVRRRSPWPWLAAAAAAAILVVALVLQAGNGSETIVDPGSTASTTLTPASAPVVTTPVSASAPSTSAPAPGGVDTVSATIPAVPGVATTVTPAPATTAAPATTDAATTTAASVPAQPATTMVEPARVGPVGDPERYGEDGFLRELVDARTLRVASSPPVTVTMDVPEPAASLIGVGPQNVAYLLVETDGAVPTTARVIAVPTTGSTAGTVIPLGEPFSFDAVWYPRLTPQGIRLDSVETTGSWSYVDPSGQPLAGDPSFSWTVGYVAGPAGDVSVVVTEDATGRQFTVPATEPAREGQSDRPLRPLPDGRVAVTTLDADGGWTTWVLDPGTGTWAIAG